MYSKFTEDELIEAYSTMIDYSRKANDAILKEIDERGGLDKFLQTIQQKEINKKESDRVLNELINLNKAGKDLEMIKKDISSEVWTKQHLNAFIENRYIRHQLYVNDKTIDKELISRIIIATIFATFSGIGIFVLSFIIFKYFYFVSLVLVYFISYLIIKGYTGKTNNNGAVFLGGLISTIISILIALLIWNK